MGKKNGPGKMVGTTPKRAEAVQQANEGTGRTDTLSDGLTDPLGDRLSDPLGDVQIQAGTAVQASGPIAEPAAADGRKHPDAKGEKPFTKQELTWINQVLAHPLVKVLFSTYTDIPTATLHRVAAIAGAKGQFNAKNDDIAISDSVYKNKDKHKASDGTTFTETNEEAFKGTLIHELFHHADENAKIEKAGTVLPSTLVAVLSQPEAAGFPKYAFGWFVHPKSKYVLHFQLNECVSLNSQVTLIDQPELNAVRKSGKWERSPMPESGKSISAEEDMCESISLALTSKRTHDAFKTAYPQRYKLLDNYFGSLLRLAQKGK